MFQSEQMSSGTNHPAGTVGFRAAEESVPTNPSLVTAPPLQPAVPSASADQAGPSASTAVPSASAGTAAAYFSLPRSRRQPLEKCYFLCATTQQKTYFYL